MLFTYLVLARTPGMQVAGIGHYPKTGAMERSIQNQLAFLQKHLDQDACPTSQPGKTITAGCTRSASAKVLALSSPILIRPDSIAEIVD